MLCDFENHASFLWAVFPNMVERMRIFCLLICTQKFEWKCSGPAVLLIQLASCLCCLSLPGTSWFFFLISFLQQLLGLVVESYYFILCSRKLFSTFLHIQLFLLIPSSHLQGCSCLLGQEACAKLPPTGIIIFDLRQSSDFAGQCVRVSSERQHGWGCCRIRRQEGHQVPHTGCEWGALGWPRPLVPWIVSIACCKVILLKWGCTNRLKLGYDLGTA